MIATAEDADVWMRMLDDRNWMTRLYDEAAPIAIHARIQDEYAPALAAMVRTLSELRWT